MIGVDWQKTKGPAIRFRCPVCSSDNENGRSYQHGEQIRLLHAIPLMPYKETNYVQCGQCGERFVSPVNVFELPNYSTDEIAGLLQRQVSFISAAMAVLGILLSVVPIVGLGLAIGALLLNWRRPRQWTKIVSWLALLLAIAANIAFFILLKLGY